MSDKVEDTIAKSDVNEVRASSRRDFILVAVVSFAAIMPFLLAPIRAQILGPAGRGEFAFFQSSVTAAGIFSALGLRFACYELNFLKSHRFSFRISRLFIYAMLGAGIIIVPTTWVAFNEISPIVGFAIAATLLLAPGAALVQIETANANFVQRRERIAKLSSVPPVFEFLVTLVLVVLQKFNLLFALLITLGAEAIRTTTAGIWYFRDRHKHNHRSSAVDRRMEKRLVTASFKNAPAVVTPLLSGNLDILLFALWAPTTVLGHYAVAKLGFSVLVIIGSVLEGRFLASFRRQSKIRGLVNVVVCAGVLAAVCGITGWWLVPIIFGMEFTPSAMAFPFLAGAGGLALLFACLSAATAQDSKSSVYPGLAVLLSLAVTCLAIPAVVGTDVVSLTWALVAAQLVGVIFVAIQFLKGGSK